LAPGPRIASTPESSPIHPSQMFFKRLLASSNVAAVCLNLVGASPHNEVKEQVLLIFVKISYYFKAVLALGSFAAHNAESRDYGNL
jgi:hypothetical protein